MITFKLKIENNYIWYCNNKSIEYRRHDGLAYSSSEKKHIRHYSFTDMIICLIV